MSKHKQVCGLGFQVSPIFYQIKCWPHRTLVLLSLKVTEFRIFASGGKICHVIRMLYRAD